MARAKRIGASLSQPISRAGLRARSGKESCWPGRMGPSFMPAESFCAWQEFCKGEAEQNIRALVQKAREQGVKTHKVMLAGRAEHALLAAAERLGVDLIVIGAHGHRGVSGFLAGNVAVQLISHASCSVLTAREGRG